MWLSPRWRHGGLLICPTYADLVDVTGAVWMHEEIEQAVGSPQRPR